MRASTLNTRVTVQQRGSGTDAWGKPNDTWTDVCTVWADARHVGGLEAAKAGTELSTARASVRIRWRTGLTAGMRCVIGGVPYDIKAVLPDLRGREFVDLVCEATA